MSDPQVKPIQLGDRVKILDGLGRDSGMVGRVIELRGPLGYKGRELYGIRIRRKPRPGYVELPAEQLEVIPSDK